MSALKYWVWLSGRGKMSPDDAKGLLERFGSPENIYFADTEELETFHYKSALSRKIAEDKDLSGTMKTIDRCVEAGYRIITMQDSEYPVRLKNIFDPPVVLYVQMCIRDRRYRHASPGARGRVLRLRNRRNTHLYRGAQQAY